MGTCQGWGTHQHQGRWGTDQGEGTWQGWGTHLSQGSWGTGYEGTWEWASPAQQGLNLHMHAHLLRRAAVSLHV